MSDRVRNLLTMLMLFLLAGAAFVAGYFTNDFVELRGGGTLVQEQTDFDLFWEAWNLLESNFIGDLPTAKEMTYSAIRGVVSALNDPYTVFVEPVIRTQEREQLQGSFGGIGAYLSRPEDGGDVILDPIPGNPAEIAGILTGDVLLAVDGVEITADFTVAQIVEMIKGEKGSAVTLTVLHPGETEPVNIEVERDDILIPSVTYRLLTEDESIGYIQLTRFSGESSNEIEEAVADLLEQGAEKLVLDLRNNGGGLLDAAVQVSDHFMDEGPVLYQQIKGETERIYETTDETLAPDIPLVVLVNGGTASASEILAGALHDRERAVLVGQRTFGKGSVQLVFDLSDGSSVHVTSSRWFTPDRHLIDQQGLEPDFVVEITQEAIDNGRDEVLDRAIEYLQSGN
ncbi:MAG: S41 family peptidase [Ardenticatenaceae bacterium]|nr:S41 family peptidase [Ardenticatenaceae bacterium]